MLYYIGWAFIYLFIRKRIFIEWLPNSGYDHDEGPEIEWYSNGDMNSDNYLSEIWIPIKKSNK